VHETRRDEVQEVLSFKDLKATASPPAGSASPTASPIGASVTPKPAVPTAAPPPLAAAVPPDPPVAAGPTLTVSAPMSPRAPVSSVADSRPERVASLPPPAAAPAVVPPVALAPAQGAEAPGLSEVAKIESRLGELEAATKERSNATVTRADVDKAETQTSDQISRLAAIVTRLTGQVKDLEDQVRTESAGAQEKLADLTRRVSLSESKSAVAAAERANVSQAAAATASVGVEGQAQGGRMKVAGGDQKRRYRIQAASPGLAMLSAIDGGPDDRPLEVAIGTDLPGYGKVRSIEQHGQAWVVKADRGSIE
jgi:TolA-binding protein